MGGVNLRKLFLNLLLLVFEIPHEKMDLYIFSIGCLSHCYMGGAFQATARFQDSGIIQKAIKMALRLILSVNSLLFLSGVQL